MCYLTELREKISRHAAGEPEADERVYVTQMVVDPLDTSNDYANLDIVTWRVNSLNAAFSCDNKFFSYIALSV